MPTDWTGRSLRAANRPGGVAIGPLLAAGGEGAVYRIDRADGFLAKIYHTPPSPLRVAKLTALARCQHPGVRRVTAMPIDLLQDGLTTVGFVMPMADQRKAVHHWYSPKDRKNHFPRCTYDLLVAIARNLAACVEEIHDADMVIGDINQSGFLIGTGPDNMGTVAAIDCDSFQIQAGQQLLPCEVGTPEYTPPELIGKSFAQVMRTRDHDAFGLAVLIFQLLQMGRHPFAGMYRQEVDDGLATAIARGWYVYGDQASRLGIAPPKASLPVAIAGPRIPTLWSQAFLAPPHRRPPATEWVTALKDLVSSLTTCPDDERHRYFRGLTACPWCSFATSHHFEFFVTDRRTEEVVFGLDRVLLDRFLQDMGAWMDALEMVAIPPVSMPPGRPAWFVEDQQALAAHLDGMRPLFAETWAYCRELDRQETLGKDWADTCHQIQARNTDQAARWEQEAKSATAAHTSACWNVQYDNNVAAVAHRFAMRAYTDRLQTSTGLIQLTLFAWVVSTVLVSGMLYTVLSYSALTSAGCLTLVGIAIMLGLVVQRRRIKASAPVPPLVIPVPPPPPLRDRPEPMPFPDRPTFPLLLAPRFPTIALVVDHASKRAAPIIGKRRSELAPSLNTRERALSWVAECHLYAKATRDSLPPLLQRIRAATADYHAVHTTYQREVAALQEQWKNDAYRQFLDSIEITEAKGVGGLGHGLIATLIGYNIETALDVVTLLVTGEVKVPGFAEERIGKLHRWVQNDVTPRFNPNRFPFDDSPTVQSLRRATAREKSRLERSITETRQQITAIREAYHATLAHQRAHAATYAAQFAAAQRDDTNLRDLITWWEDRLARAAAA